MYCRCPPERYKRIMIVYVKGLDAEGFGSLMFKSSTSPADVLKEKLTAQGFEAFIYESPIQKIMKQQKEGKKVDLNVYFAGKDAIQDFVEGQDPVDSYCGIWDTHL